MANPKDPNLKTNEMAFSFTEFNEDIQLCILSFLSPTEIVNLACTSKRFVSLCRNNKKLWYAMCDRRWGSKTQIKKWGNGRISYKLLYKTLDEWENLIGFWRRCGQTNTTAISPPLILFEWASSFLAGSRVSPSKNGTYHVTKAPFLWMGISPDGQVVNFLDLDGQSELSSDFEACFKFGILDSSNIVPANVSFVGNGHVLVDENQSFAYSSLEEKRNGFRRSSSSGSLRGEESEDAIGGGGSPGSLPDRLVSEKYIQFANRTSPGGDKARRQRKKEKERQRKRKWEPEHFVKVVDCSPTPSRPLQGLWKGICEGMNLDFYLVIYDEVGGITCRKVGDSFPYCYSTPVFWTSNATFIDSPFSPEEECMYDGRVHLGPLAAEAHTHCLCSSTDTEVLSRILYINSSNDLVPGVVGTADPSNGEGRIWLYKNGTFGFGFLWDHFVIDLNHIVQDGCLLDMIEVCSE